jgi:uncharacterized protein YndB with AHSA1/START domain
MRERMAPSIKESLPRGAQRDTWRRMPMIRRQISIDSPPRSVWSALSTTEGLQGWLASAARVDARQGGRVVVTLRDGGEEVGLLHAYRPTSKMEIHWDKRGEGPWKGSFLSFLVGRTGKETIVNVQHDGPAMEDPTHRAALDDYWRRRLTELRDRIEAEAG